MDDTNNDNKANPNLVMFGGELVDRKKMEEERLARLKRRREAESGSPQAGHAEKKARTDVREDANSGVKEGQKTGVKEDAKVAIKEDSMAGVKKDSKESVKEDSKAGVKKDIKETAKSTTTSAAGPSRASHPTPNPPPAAHPQPTISSSTKTASPPFLAGTLRRTAARGFPRQPDDITIDEILQKDRLELAVVSSYCWDDEWLVSKIDLARTRTLLIAYAPDARTVRKSLSASVKVSGVNLYRIVY
jgi:hypothetical protein